MTEERLPIFSRNASLWWIHNVCHFEFSDELQEMRKKLNDAEAEKQEVDLITRKADSVDRTIIEALKREGEEQKEKVKSITL